MRCNLAKLSANAVGFGLKFNGTELDVAPGFPQIDPFIDSFLPQLELSVPNPELDSNGHLAGNGGSNDSITEEVDAEMASLDETGDLDSSQAADSTMDKSALLDRSTLSMDAVDEELEATKSTASSNGDSNGMDAFGDTPASRALQSVSLFVSYLCSSTSGTVPAGIYRILPYICQFVGTENQKPESRRCMSAMCYLSVLMTPAEDIPEVLEICTKVRFNSSTEN